MRVNFGQICPKSMAYPVCYSPAMEMCYRAACRLLVEVNLIEETWEEIEIPSNTEPGKTYIVAYSPHGAGHSLCDCKGFENRGYCSHIKAANQILNCEWTSNEQVRPLEERSCPLCGSDTFPVPTRK